MHPAMKQKKLLTPPSGGSGGIILDRLLVPRITNYAMNHSLSDLDEVAEGLRSTYRDYKRSKMAPFKQMVARAIKVVQNRGGAVKPELQLQVREEGSSRKSHAAHPSRPWRSHQCESLPPMQNPWCLLG